MFRSIRFKLSLFVFLLLIFTTFVFSLATVKILNQAILNQIIKRAESLCKSSAEAAAYSLISGDALGMDHLVFKGKESNSDVEYMAVIDTQRNVMAHSDVRKRGEVLKRVEENPFRKNANGTVVRELPLSSGRFFEISRPIVFKEKLFGTVIVGMNQSALIEAQRLARHRMFVVLTVILLVGLIGILGLSFLITRAHTGTLLGGGGTEGREKNEASQDFFKG